MTTNPMIPVPTKKTSKKPPKHPPPGFRVVNCYACDAPVVITKGVPLPSMCVQCAMPFRPRPHG